MKQLIPFGVIAVVFCFASCKKELLPGENNAGIPGKWNITSDSSYVGFSADNHLVVYTGQQGDYFDFRSDGKLYIKENNSLETLDYNLTSQTTLTINSFIYDSGGTTQSCTITTPTSHTTIISTNMGVTPGGDFNRKVTLNR